MASPTWKKMRTASTRICPAFHRAFLQPAPFVPVGNRWDEDVRKFRQEAQTKIPQLIEAQKASATKAPKQEKKIQGGC